MDPNTRQAKRSPVTLKIKFKSASLEEFIERYAVDVSHGGIFIRTKEPLAVGTTMKFEFQLKDATPLIGGEGTVVWTRENDPARPGVAPGMGVRFDRLNEGSQSVLDRILAQKAKSGATSASTVDPKVFEQPTRAFGANEAPTRVAPSPLAAASPQQAAAMVGAIPDRPRLGGMAPPKSGFQDERTDATPLPNPVPFHSDADEFPEEAFEEATKVRSLEDLVAQTAKTDEGVARPAPAPAPAPAPSVDAAMAAAAAAASTALVDELAARRASADAPKAEAAPAKVEPASKPVAEAKPEPASKPVAEPKVEAKPKAEAKPEPKPAPKPEPKAQAKPVSKARAATPTPAAAKEPAPAPTPPPSSSSALPILIVLVLLVGGAIAAYFLVYKKKGEPTETTGSGTASATGTGTASATGAGTASASGTGTAIASGTGTDVGTGTASGTDVGTGTSAMAGTPDAGIAAAELVTVTIGANVKGASVEVVGTDMTGTAPYKAKLEKGKSYTARVTAPGYLAVEVEVSAEAKTTTATLEPLPAVLHVESSPAGAAIYIDNEITGKVTPADITLTAKQAAKAQLHVVLRKANYDKIDVVVKKAAFKPDGDQLLANANGSLRATKKSGGGGGNGSGSGTGKASGSGTASGTDAGSGTGTASSGSGTGTASSSGSGTASGTSTSSGSGSGTASGSGTKPGTGSGSGSGSASGTGTKPGSGTGTSEPTPDWAG